MTTETETNRGRLFVTVLLPWLAAGGMLLVYLLTVNHSVTPGSIYRISELSGWYSPQRFFAPLTYLATYPFHWLPGAMIAPGLKIFTAVCGALSLALLARSVALLPHDRTHEQRMREVSEFSCLTIRMAWLPPLFAVLVCGLQMTFWENSSNTAGSTSNLTYFGTDAPGEMLDLLLFAYCIRCLLEHRISMKDSWLGRFAFVYGLAMANNWLMIGLFPGFLAALIWIRGLSFFSARCLGILTICGFAGLALIFLFPFLTSVSHLPGMGFWEAVRHILRTEKLILTALPRETMLLISLTSVLPLFIVGIRWASYFGDSSQLGVIIATFAFHIVHGLFLLACIWVAFDPPISPRQKGLGLTFLPLYYLAALNIGYFAGYFLLIFGTRPPKERRRPHPVIRAINFAVAGCICVLAVTVPVFLVWHNLPQLQAHQSADAAFARFSALSAESLPKQGAVVLSDDPMRLLFVQNIASRGVEKVKHLFINTSSLFRDPSYIRNLEKNNPDYKLAGALTNTARAPSSLELLELLDRLAEHHDIYYLHPSFGYFFERYYAQPRGIVYQLKRFAANEWKVPLPTAAQIEENQKFWKGIAESELPGLVSLIEKTKHPVTTPVLAKVMESGHLTLEPNQSALLLGAYYSHYLNYWGSELERANQLPEAGKCFEQSLQLNHENVSAQINYDFNREVQTGKKIVIEQPRLVLDKFGKHRGWTDLLSEDGPFVDPSFSYVLGVALGIGENYREGAQRGGGGGLYLEAAQQFDRVITLAPYFSDGYLALCKTLLMCRMNSDAQATAEELLKQNPNEPNALFYQGVAFMQQGMYEKALVPFTHLLTLQTNHYPALMDRAISNLQLRNYAASKADYENLQKLSPQSYQIDFGLQEIAFQEKNTNALVKYLELYLTNYYQSFPTNYTAPETDEVKSVKQRLKESKNGAP